MDQQTGVNQPLGTLIRKNKAAYFSEVIPSAACKTEPSADQAYPPNRNTTGRGSRICYDRSISWGSYGSTAALVYLRQYPQMFEQYILGVAPPNAPLPLPAIKVERDRTSRRGQINDATR